MEEFIKILKALTSGFFTGIIISIPLGPAAIESVKRTLSEGFREGFKVSIGALCADIAYLLLINCGLSNLLNENKKTESMFWIISGLTLTFIGFLSIKGKDKCKGKCKNRYNAIYDSKLISMPFLSGFIITFSNPMTPSLWLTLSGTVIRAWYYVNSICYYSFLFSILLGMIAWFATLNYFALKGKSILNPKATETTSLLLKYSIIVIGVIFVIFGLINYILNI